MSTINTHTFVNLDPDGDMTIEAVEYDLYASNGKGGHPILKTATFKVSRRKLLDTCDSNVIRGMLGGSFMEGKLDNVEFHEVTIVSVELWLRRLHDAFIPESYQIPIAEVWNAIGFGRQYFLHNDRLNEWFAEYYLAKNVSNMSFEDMREWLFPCQEFDHAVGFAYVTKTLAHCGIGHTQEANPTNNYTLHMEGRVIQQLNAARGSIRKEIIKGLFNPLECICFDECEAHEKSVKAYLDAVRKTDVWPIEDLNSKSSHFIINGPGFTNWNCVVPDNACDDCLESLRGDHIRNIRLSVLSYWDGLCLDCMDISKPGDRDREYWLHNSRRKYDHGCRLKHSRNTWYFSFMGRPELMDTFKRDQAERKAKRNSGVSLSSTRFGGYLSGLGIKRKREEDDEAGAGAGGLG